MQLRTRRTKIVATIGPATLEPQVLRRLIQAGATTLRLNFSHGTQEDHHRSIRLIRQTAFELNQPVGILQDLQGPKIRLGKFATGSIIVSPGDPFILTSREVECTETRSYVSYDRLADEVPTGAAILLDDGKIEMVVEKVVPETGDLHCRVTVGGKLSSNKGVNFPGVTLSVKALTDKDRADLMFGLDQGVDWVALSFVRNRQDIVEIKELIANTGKSVPVIAKIEKHEAIQEMEAILKLCDGVMVARGDLGVELPAEEVPLLQKQLIATANHFGIPVITATQMLDSMVSNPRPTRAEVSDVANAILDGTDAVMLSNETAVGQYPVEAVATMARIAHRIEADRVALQEQPASRCSLPPSNPHSIPLAIAAAVSQIAAELESAAIVSLTKTGSTARNVSKFRPRTPILAVTSQREVAQQLQLVWGVKPLVMKESASNRQTFQAAINMAQENGLLRDGELVVMTAGTLRGVAGSTDLVKVEVVRAILGKGTGIGQGIASGRARVARHAKELRHFSQGEILVVPATNADFVEAMRRAGGIITEEDSLSSHAAVIGLRLGIPVIVGCKEATQIVREGTILTLDARRGLVLSGTMASHSFNGDHAHSFL